MALIGTISGSVGAGGVLISATAISGTLVVADSPASVFPTLPTDVKFFVSGVQGAIAASLPGVAVFGGDLRVSGSSYFTDIDVTGHGAVAVQPYGTSTGQTGEVRFKELAANGGNYTALRAADSISANLVLTLPDADGANGNILKTSGTGVTSFVDASSVVTGALSVVSINASGDITGSSLLLTNGFVVTGSGIIESNTSTTALRITQKGSGNAIIVEDSTNPDSSPFVVAADGKVGIGTTSPVANLFVSGTDPLIPILAVKGHDVSVNTLAVTSSAGASTAIGFVNIDQGNYANKYGLAITNIGTGQSGLKLAANTTGGSFAIDNMNTTPQITMTHKNLWFNSVSTAFDTSQITYKFIENNKGVTYPNQKTFLISGNTNGYKTGSYFEVEKSGSIKLLELQGDTNANALFVSGSILTSGSVFIAGDLAVSGGDITTTSTTFNLITGSATTVNFAQSADTLNIGKLTGNVVISSHITGSGKSLFGDSVTLSGPSSADLLTLKTTVNLFNTTATTLNIGGTTTTSSFPGATQVDGRSTLSSITEKLVPSVGGTGTVAYDLSVASIFYANGPTGDITANFTNVPTTNNRIITPTVILSQSATPRIVSEVQIDTAVQTINWANGVTPAGTAGKQDVFGFSLVRSGSTWKVFGQMSTYG